LLPILIVIGLLSMAPSPLLAKGKVGRLVRVLQSDGSFKVRLKALRILAKRLRKSQDSKASRLLTVIRKSAREDQHYLVRGMACFILGQSALQQSIPSLENAMSDVHPFVRVQAASALALIKQASSQSSRRSCALLVSTSSMAPTLVFAVEAMPGANIPQAMIDKMAKYMGSNLARASNEMFSFHNEVTQGQVELVDSSKQSSGFKLRSSIAKRSLTRIHGRKLQLSVAIRVTITTWPENNLRHVISAEASAELNRVEPAFVAQLETEVLQGAVDRGITDIMKEISRGKKNRRNTNE